MLGKQMILFKHYNDYVVRIIGEIIVLVNIVDNSIYEIDENVKSYIDYAKQNDGNIDEMFFTISGQKTLEQINVEIKELLEALDRT